MSLPAAAAAASSRMIMMTTTMTRWPCLFFKMPSTKLLFLNRMLYCGGGAREWRQCLRIRPRGVDIPGRCSHFLKSTPSSLSLQSRRCFTEGKKAVEEGLKTSAKESSSTTSAASSSTSTSSAAASSSSADPVKKQSLIQKFKAMYKDYYYVLIPVHVVTSIGWLGSFYQVSKSGMDIAGYMKKMGFSDGIISKITESGMGHVAVAYALYKIATPARYTVTLGGTTWAINRLTRMGYIKPAKEIISQGKERLKNLKPDKK